MNDSFDRFTERARKVLTLAQEEAQRFNHNYISTEHLLLGLVAEGDGIAAKVLSNLGIELTKVRSSVEFIIGRGERQPMGEIGLTPRAKKVIELARDEARRLGHHYIGTEHLLLGLIREGEGIAAGVLESLGVNLERGRSEVMNVLTEVGVGEEPSSSEPNELAREYAAAVTRQRQRDSAGWTRGPAAWEYLTLETTRQEGAPQVHLVNGEQDHRLKDVTLHWALQVLGKEGWELAGIDIGEGQQGRAVYIFKRPQLSG